VAVVSAMSGVTDDLLKLAQKISQKPTERELDLLLATGEQSAIALTAMAINALGGRAVSLTGAAAGIVTDNFHTRAKIANITPRQILALLADDYIVIVAGFQGQTPQGEITTLGRGGSDLTAIALAAALQADDCQIFTDVDGVFTCDPKVVSDASKMDEIAYDRNQAKITICGVPDRPGCAGVIFSAISAANLSVDMIVQNASSTGTTDLSFTLHKDDFDLAEKILAPLVPKMGAAGMTAKSGVAKLSVVGIGMRSHSGVASRLFQCLGEADVNIQLISTSEIKIAVVIDESEVDRAARATHAAFGLSRPVTLPSAPARRSGSAPNELSASSPA
jgi:aspartate kinase